MFYSTLISFLIKQFYSIFLRLQHLSLCQWDFNMQSDLKSNMLKMAESWSNWVPEWCCGKETSSTHKHLIGLLHMWVSSLVTASFQSIESHNLNVVHKQWVILGIIHSVQLFRYSSSQSELKRQVISLYTKQSYNVTLL